MTSDQFAPFGGARLVRAAAVAAAMLVAFHAAAAPPKTLSYQGFLTSAADAPIDAPVQITFSLYATPTGGAALWSETQPSVTVAKGEFSTILGNVTPLTLAFDVPYYLGVAVGSDPEMTPRPPLAASAYAFRALALDSAATLPGSVLTGTIPTATIPGTQVTGSIDTATVPGSQVTGSITTATIPGSNVTGDLSGVSNILLPNSTASVGNILKGGAVFMHDFGGVFVGPDAGNFSISGSLNTAIGSGTLFKDTTGSNNVAVGDEALASNTSGGSNTAVGAGALVFATTGSNNIALGQLAGFRITTESDNIEIGAPGSPGESNVIRIGNAQAATYIVGIHGVTTGGAGIPVLIDPSGQLGTLTSSRTVKEDIADMGDASALLMKLRPVTFHYKQRPGWPLQYGLIAEEVAEVAPDLAARGPDGKIETVYYQDLPPMLLNEYQKQQRVIEAQQDQLRVQRMQIEALERRVGEVDSLERRLRELESRLESR